MNYNNCFCYKTTTVHPAAPTNPNKNNCNKNSSNKICINDNIGPKSSCEHQKSSPLSPTSLKTTKNVLPRASSSYVDTITSTTMVTTTKPPSTATTSTSIINIADTFPKLPSIYKNNYVHKQHRQKQVNKIYNKNNNSLYSSTYNNNNLHSVGATSTEVTMAMIQQQNSIEINYLISSHSDHSHLQRTKQQKIK